MVVVGEDRLEELGERKVKVLEEHKVEVQEEHKVKVLEEICNYSIQREAGYTTEEESVWPGKVHILSLWVSFQCRLLPHSIFYRRSAFYTLSPRAAVDIEILQNLPPFLGFMMMMTVQGIV